MPTYILSHDELSSFLISLVGWHKEGDAIVKHFQFKNFKKALAFIIEVGLLAEQLDHHPEIINVYNKVTLRLSTHSHKSITNKDTNLAIKINELIAD